MLYYMESLKQSSQSPSPLRIKRKKKREIIERKPILMMITQIVMMIIVKIMIGISLINH